MAIVLQENGIRMTASRECGENDVPAQASIRRLPKPSSAKLTAPRALDRRTSPVMVDISLTPVRATRRASFISKKVCTRLYQGSARAVAGAELIIGSVDLVAAASAKAWGMCMSWANGDHLEDARRELAFLLSEISLRPSKRTGCKVMEYVVELLLQWSAQRQLLVS